MKKKYAQILTLISVSTCWTHILNAEQVITFFMRPYPSMQYQQKKVKHQLGKLHRPEKIAKAHIRPTYFPHTPPLVKGIFSTYGGYVAMSNAQGQTIFPRKQVMPLFYLIITNKITPRLMAGNTIHHWEIEQGTPAAMYKIERIHDDETNVYYWQTEQVDLPEDNRLPVESITILAKPKHIYVPVGATLTQEQPNIILPDIFIKEGIKTDANALYLLAMRQFFGQLQPVVKKGVARYLTRTIY